MNKVVKPDLAAEERQSWTLLRPETKSGADWLACATQDERESFLNDLSDGALMALPYLFEFWALDHQLPPEGDWRTWVIMGGRGAGKTRAGSEWVRSEVEGAGPLDPGRSRRVALVGETIDQVREVMVFGESGILACSPPDRRPVWEAGRRRLVWPNGAIAQVFSAYEPESLHPRWGNGSLGSVAMSLPRKAEPLHDDPDFLDFLLTVYAALKARHTRCTQRRS